MVTFKQFLSDFSEEVEETFESVSMTENAKIAVVSVMSNYLGERRFDPIELMELFEMVCVSAMNKSQINREVLEQRVNQAAKAVLTEEPQYSDFPEISFEEAEERRAFGR